jgi:hypothetical protein
MKSNAKLIADNGRYHVTKDDYDWRPKPKRQKKLTNAELCAFEFVKGVPSFSINARWSYTPR